MKKEDVLKLTKKVEELSVKGGKEAADNVYAIYSELRSRGEDENRVVSTDEIVNAYHMMNIINDGLIADISEEIKAFVNTQVVTVNDIVLYLKEVNGNEEIFAKYTNSVQVILLSWAHAHPDTFEASAILHMLSCL